MDFWVEEATLDTALNLLSQLPEFDTLKNYAYYAERLTNTDHLILVAKSSSEIVGCKIGYDMFNDGSFYSWLGGVLPQFRQFGIARALAEQQEKWARDNGYTSIKFKTQNRHKAMLQFALKNGFNIYHVIPKENLDQYRIELIKSL